MKKDKLEALLEGLNLTEAKAQEIRLALKEALNTKKATQKIDSKEARLLVMAKIVDEQDWRKRAAMVAGLISSDL